MLKYVKLLNFTALVLNLKIMSPLLIQQAKLDSLNFFFSSLILINTFTENVKEISTPKKKKSSCLSSWPVETIIKNNKHTLFFMREMNSRLSEMKYGNTFMYLIESTWKKNPTYITWTVFIYVLWNNKQSYSSWERTELSRRHRTYIERTLCTSLSTFNLRPVPTWYIPE